MSCPSGVRPPKKIIMKPTITIIVAFGFIAFYWYAVLSVWHVLPKDETEIASGKVHSVVELCRLWNGDDIVMSIHFDHSFNCYGDARYEYGPILEKSIACRRENTCDFVDVNPPWAFIRQLTYVNVTQLLDFDIEDVKLWISPHTVNTLNLSHVPVTAIQIDHSEPFTKNYVARSIWRIAIAGIIGHLRIWGWICRFFKTTTIDDSMRFDLFFGLFALIVVITIAVVHGDSDEKATKKEKKKKQKKKKKKDKDE